MRATLQALAGGVSLAVLALSGASAHEIRVPIDEVRIITFPSEVKTVYVGNPAIADVTVIDAHRVFIMGKVFGSTNLVALDPQGHASVSERVSVYGKAAGMVTVHSANAQRTFVCAEARCEASPVPGDDRQNYFDPVYQERDTASGQALAAANGGRGGGAQ
jgi:hypothetical protein